MGYVVTVGARARADRVLLDHLQAVAVDVEFVDQANVFLGAIIAG